jgi:hypothetical protein
MLFPTCRPVTGDTKPDNVPGLTADKFAQYLFHDLLLNNRRTLTLRDGDIWCIVSIRNAREREKKPATSIR